jgi:Dolichyl-phosphate-mannose-protein mannosyltransferase
MRGRLSDAAWFQYGSYKVFDDQAQDILDQKQSLFWISDSSRTDKIVYPPGYSLWLALVYKLTGSRSAVDVQDVQLVIDSLAVLLIVGIGVTAYGWTIGLTAGLLAALSPLLAISGATPSADAPTSWLVLGGVWSLMVATKTNKVIYAMAAGALLGVACWFRVNPLFLFIPWAIALSWFLRDGWKKRVKFGAALAFATLLVIAPIVIRNVVVFYPQIAPTGLGIGWNLLAGIGETERGPELGAPCCDTEMIEQDRRTMNFPADAKLGLFFPDGIRRDRERGRRALGIIAAHPVWFTGVMARRLGGHLKYFGKPAPHLGTAGINVTSRKCLAPEHQAGVLGIAVNLLGSIQSILRTVALPLMLVGVVIAWHRARRITTTILTTVAYYLVALAIGHSEIRYGLPMQALLFLFAAVTLSAAYKSISAKAQIVPRSLRKPIVTHSERSY